MKNRRRLFTAVISLCIVTAVAFVITDSAGSSPRFGFIQTVSEFLGMESISAPEPLSTTGNAMATINVPAGDATAFIAAINTANANGGADTIVLAGGTY